MFVYSCTKTYLQDFDFVSEISVFNSTCIFSITNLLFELRCTDKFCPTSRTAAGLRRFNVCFLSYENMKKKKRIDYVFKYFE